MSALMLLQKLDPEISQTIIRSLGWYLAFGIALSLLGVAAIIRSVTATVLTMFFFGWVLVISAAIEVAQAFMVGAWVGFLVHALSASFVRSYRLVAYYETIVSSRSRHTIDGGILSD